MNEERRAAVREVSEFILRSAPEGAVEWAKKTEPYKTKISDAQRRAGDPTFPIKSALKSYAGGFFGAFRAYFDMKHPDHLTTSDVKLLPLTDLWHAGSRVRALDCTSDLGRYCITPRRSNDPDLQPSFSAAEISLLRVIGVSDRLMVESGLIDMNTSVHGAMVAIMATKTAFPGALVTELTDCLGDTHHLIPLSLQS
tara:strand:- start:1830 stop:2420 length:591 start_codon:yes stop_codon:yes gene_type:complete